MILLNRHKMFPKGKWSFLITLAFIICLQLSNRRQFVSGDEEVASDLNVMPIEVDPNFKNFKYIGNKIIPDVSTIMKLDEPHLINLKEFLKAGGLTTLEYDGYKVVRDVPFSIIVPKVDMTTIEKPRLKDFILEHLIPGKAFGEFNPEELYGNSNGHKIQFTNVDLKWTLNGLKVIQKIKFNTNLTAIFIDGVLVDRKAAFSKRNIQEHNRYNEPQRLEMKNQTTKYESTSTKDSTPTTTNTKSSPLMTFLSNMKSGTKVFQHFLSKSNLTQIMDDGHYTILIPADSAFQRWHPIDWGFYPFSVQEFTENILRNHFLPTSSSAAGAGGASASQQTTILTSPSYSSIASQPSLSIASIGGGNGGGIGGQRGGNNEGIISGTGNAVHSGPLRMSDIKNVDKMTIKTLGGESVVFRSNPSPSVNNVTILSDYTLPNGNQIFIISEVLFVSEAVVSKLHQMHKDKETPPLLAFPWFGAQFLSHSFLALERDSRFTQITRYLNNAEIAPYISGANYTFFVPEDGAFEKNGFNTIPDDILASPKGVKMLLNHFVKGRLYDRDLKDNEIFETIGGGVIKVQRKPGNNITTINMAKITESEIFVYNLGTMFYIDDILYSDILREYAITTSSSPKIPLSPISATSTIQTIISTSTISSNSNFNPSLSSSSQSSSSNNNGIVTSTNFKPFYPTYSPPSSSSDVEIVPSEFITENTGTESDILLDNNNNNNNNHNNNNNNNNHNNHNHNGRGRIPIDQISLEDELDDDEIITPKALPVRFAPKK